MPIRQKIFVQVKAAVPCGLPKELLLNPLTILNNYIENQIGCHLIKVSPMQLIPFESKLGFLSILHGNSIFIYFFVKPSHALSDYVFHSLDWRAQGFQTLI